MAPGIQTSDTHQVQTHGSKYTPRASLHQTSGTPLNPFQIWNWVTWPMNAVFLEISCCQMTLLPLALSSVLVGLLLGPK